MNLEWPIVAVGGAVIVLGLGKLLFDYLGHVNPRRPRQPWE